MLNSGVPGFKVAVNYDTRLCEQGRYSTVNATPSPVLADHRLI
ncbi:MAG: hypothetical protein NT105_24410 [Verrucomicrobia bacterium]|nr:hypothetical protein [Verrucomicrobiota bacterium]